MIDKSTQLSLCMLFSFNIFATIAQAQSVLQTSAMSGGGASGSELIAVIGQSTPVGLPLVAGADTLASGLLHTYTFFYPAEISLKAAITFPSHDNPADFRAEDYQLIGLPGASNRSIKDFMTAGEPGKAWQAYWDDGTTGDYIKYDGSATFQFATGRAFWIIHKDDLTISTTVTSASQNASILLHTGWNLITNPFTSAIEWSAIQAANKNFTARVCTWSPSKGQFEMPTRLEPYVGYYLFKPSNVDTLKIPYYLVFAAANSPANESAIAWQVNIALSAQGYRDDMNAFGVAKEAKPQLDEFDLRKPRAFAATPTVSFNRQQWDRAFGLFASDIRPEIVSSESWDFEVRTNPREAAQLEFFGIDKVPAHFEVHLIDESHARTINLREGSVHQFIPTTELSRYRVIVGRKEAVQEQLNSVALPKEFALGQNYPNPFNPSTTIPIDIPAASEIRLEIFNVLGERVKTIYDGIIEPGRYWFNWEGRNENGEGVASGVYLYRMSTDQRMRFVKKLILVR